MTRACRRVARLFDDHRTRKRVGLPVVSSFCQHRFRWLEHQRPIVNSQEAGPTMKMPPRTVRKEAAEKLADEKKAIDLLGSTQEKEMEELKKCRRSNRKKKSWCINWKC